MDVGNLQLRSGCTGNHAMFISIMAGHGWYPHAVILRIYPPSDCSWVRALLGSDDQLTAHNFDTNYPAPIRVKNATMTTCHTT
jgi:hypothetical protein